MNDKVTTKHSWQRLEILQNIDSLGAGFTIASHDMDLRGFGNLVGDEQSGHIKEVGSELYQEILNEAISELKNQNSSEKQLDFTPSINLGIAVYIPTNYIGDSSLRLAIYRRTANLKNRSEIEAFRDEMIDRFGLLPEEFNNLLKIVEIKNICYSLKIESLDCGSGGFVVKFNKNFDTTTTANAANTWMSSTNGLTRRSTASSQRYKENIVELRSVPELHPNKLLSLPVRAFTYKADYLDSEDNRAGLMLPGFIAEEVAEIYPIAADKDDGVIESWNDRFVVPGILALVQDLHARVTTLEGGTQ
jgi:transcription-repair coupling factor (superfamily II helicase)